MLLAAWGAGLAADTTSAQAGRAATVGNFITGEGLPNPTPNVTKNWGELPAGRKWGTSAGLDIDPKDGHVWGYERCGAGTAGGGPVDCENNPVDPVFKFDRRTGKVLANIGKGTMITPHGIHVDRDGNVWVADARAPSADEIAKLPGEANKGSAVVKFSPDGKVLMTLGKPGVRGDGPDTFNQPSDVVTAPNGDIFVADGHGPGGSTNNRIVKFDKNGKFLKMWGTKGTAPGQFDTPHAIATDRNGRVYVADRSNDRIQIFDAEGKFLDQWQNIRNPYTIRVSEDGFLWVSSGVLNEFLKYDLNGKLLYHWGTYGTAPGEMWSVHEFSGDSDGNLYVAEVFGGRAQKFTPRPGADPAKIFRQQRLMPKNASN
jgi:DNA-binding beta-propeller fold protein YncE